MDIRSMGQGARAFGLVATALVWGAAAGDVQAQAMGYASGTTGGGNATPVSVSTPEQLRSVIAAYSGSGGLVVNYTGRFDFGTITDECAQWQKAPNIVEIKDKSNITIQGAQASSANFGIFITGNAQNIIIRNMAIGLLPGGEQADSITIEGRGQGRIPSKIWIDHNTIFASLTNCPGAGDASFDGGVDIKRGSNNITLSYNHFYDYQKVSLNGHSDGFPGHDTARTTYYRNRFERVKSRLPLQRFGLTHMANNYFGNVGTSGINVRMGGVSLIEGNYFENVANPVTSRDSAQIGFWDLRNNFVGPGITWDAGSSGTVNATDWRTTRAFPGALPYSLAVAPAAQVKCLVFATAGAATQLATSAPQCGSGGGTSPATINLSATGATADIGLSWTLANATPGAQEVLRDTDPDPAGRTRIGQLGSSIRSFRDSTAAAGTTYYYYVVNTSNGVVTTSNAASAQRTPSTPPPGTPGGAPPLTGTGDYPDGFSKCADLGATCSVGSGSGWVAFGRKGKWVAKFVGVGNSTPCTVAAFGSDPGGAPNKCSRQN